MRLLFLLLPVLLWSCQPSTADTAETEADAPAETTAPAPTAVPSYPSITPEKMKYLWDNCDYVDFVFYATNFSMSQSNQAAVRSTLSGVSTTPARTLAECQPVGRLFFQVDGENAEEADLFFGGNCLYYLFLENGTYTYGNQLTESAMAFYERIFTQVSTQPAQ